MLVVSSLITVVGVLVFQAPAAVALGKLRTFLTSTVDWVYMSAGNLFVLFCLLLVPTPTGRTTPPAPSLPWCSRRGWAST